VLQMVYWYNLASRDGTDSTAPSRNINTYEWRTPFQQQTTVKCPTSAFRVGQEVFVKPPGARCTTQWKHGTVTRSLGPVSVEVDGIPRHLGDVRLCDMVNGAGGDSSDNIGIDRGHEIPRRERRVPQKFEDYVM
jgi:hypothetical protein